MMPRVIVFDLDGTLTRGDSYLAFLMGYLRRRPGRWLRALHLPWAVGVFAMGARDNTWLKCVFLEAVLGGLDRNSVEQWARTFVDGLVSRGLRPGALGALAIHRQEGSRLILATASLDIYVALIADKLGFHDVVCTQTRFDERGRLTGTLHGANCYGKEKARRLKNWMTQHGIAKFDRIYTDHHSDCETLELAREAVAVNPTTKLRRLAEQRQFRIEHW